MNGLQHNSINTDRINNTPNTLRNTKVSKLKRGLIKMKHYKLRCSYCGSTINKNEALLKLHFIFHQSYILNCPVCHKQSKWITQFVLKHDQDKKERHFNKGKLFDDRI